jgi:hypothetical protein
MKRRNSTPHADIERAAALFPDDPFKAACVLEYTLYLKRRGIPTEIAWHMAMCDAAEYEEASR